MKRENQPVIWSALGDKTMEGGVVELEWMKLSAVEGAAAGVVLHKSIMLESTPPVAKHCQTLPDTDRQLAAGFQPIAHQPGSREMASGFV